MGMILRTLFLKLMLIIFPTNETSNKAGVVPIPNTIIKAIPITTSFVLIAPAIAIYTSPQGNKPFKRPINNKDPREVFINNFRKLPIKRLA